MPHIFHPPSPTPSCNPYLIHILYRTPSPSLYPYAVRYAQMLLCLYHGIVFPTNSKSKSINPTHPFIRSCVVALFISPPISSDQIILLPCITPPIQPREEEATTNHHTFPTHLQTPGQQSHSQSPHPYFHSYHLPYPADAYAPPAL